MNSFTQTLLHGWHPMRILYLLLGIVMMVQSVQGHDWPFALIGGLFLYQSIFNTGCCGMSGAYRLLAKESAQTSLDDTQYTEIK
jgi:hypothetical protein